MNVLSRQFEDHRRLINTLETNVVDEDELSQWSSSLTTQHYETLKNGITVHETVMPHWLGLAVEPPDPYSAGKIQGVRETDSSRKLCFPCQELYKFAS